VDVEHQPTDLVIGSSLGATFRIEIGCTGVGSSDCGPAWPWVRWWTVPLPAVQRGRCRRVRMTPPQLRGVQITGRSGRSVSASRVTCPPVRKLGVRRPVLVDQLRTGAGARRPPIVLGRRPRGGPAVHAAAGLCPPRDPRRGRVRAGEPDTAAVSAVCCCFRYRGRVSGWVLSTADTAARATVSRCLIGVRWLGAATAGQPG
jgi:hypothetical protein